MSISDSESRIGEYMSSQKILLVGEGDFSFSASLAEAFGSAKNMVATSLDSLDELLSKYWCQSHLDTLKERDCLVLHEVDVHHMNRHPILKDMKFDVIVFNFPHAGHFCLYETDPFLIEMHKKLVRGFFRSACEMMNEGGEVHIAHRDDRPYNLWEVKKLAEKAGLVLKEKVWFFKGYYPGYDNKRGSLIRPNGTFPLTSPYTFKFSLPPTADADETTLMMIAPSSTTFTHDDRTHQKNDEISGTISDDLDSIQMTAGSHEETTLMTSVSDGSYFSDAHDDNGKITPSSIRDTLTTSKHDHLDRPNRSDNDNHETAFDHPNRSDYNNHNSIMDVVDQMSAVVEGFTIF